MIASEQFANDERYFFLLVQLDALLRSVVCVGARLECSG